MYIETVLAPWWLQQQTSWTGPDPFPAKRMLLVCDNASVHKVDELKKLMEKYGIIFMFLPPNMTQWLQPLHRVVCGLIKTVQRGRRGRHLAAAVKQWKDEQEGIVGAALLDKRRTPIRRSLHGFLQNQPCCRGSFSIRRPTWKSYSLRKQKRDPPGFHRHRHHSIPGW